MDLRDLFKTKEPSNYVEQSSQAASPLEAFFAERTPKPSAPAQATPKAAAKIEEPKVEQIFQEYSPEMQEMYSREPSSTQEQEQNIITKEIESKPVSDLIDVQKIKSQAEQLSPQGTDWKDALASLTPLAVEALLGKGGGTSLGIAGSSILGDLEKKKSRRTQLEDKLMEIEKARAIALAKKSGSQKLPTAANLVPVQEDGMTKYKWVSEAANLPVGQKPKTGFSLEEQMSLLKYKAGLNKEMQDFKEKAKQKEKLAEKEVALSKERSQDPFTRDTRKVASAYNNLISIDPNSKDPIKDIGVVFEFMKTLDPGSVVRESEQSLVMGAKSVGDFVSNLQEMMTRQRKLTPDQIENIKKFAALNYTRRLKSQQSVVDERYLKIAKKYNLDPSVIVDTLSVGTPILWTDQNTGRTKLLNIPNDQVEEVLKLPGAKRVE